jgi:GntR family transcriptional regulator
MEIDLTSGVPSYVQLADHLRRGIRDGTYPPGEPVPSLAALCQETGLARGTVQKAIGVLVKEGRLRVVPGRATIVLGTQKKTAPPG